MLMGKKADMRGPEPCRHMQPHDPIKQRTFWEKGIVVVWFAFNVLFGIPSAHHKGGLE